MGRQLAYTVVAGGVVYPAGTAATDELEQRITNPVHWSDGDAEATPDVDDGDPAAKPARKRAAKRPTKPKDE